MANRLTYCDASFVDLQGLETSASVGAGVPRGQREDAQGRAGYGEKKYLHGKDRRGAFSAAVTDPTHG
jgi:hypothetical protein